MPYIRLRMNLTSTLLLFSFLISTFSLMSQSELFTYPKSDIKRNIPELSVKFLETEFSEQFGLPITLKLDTTIESMVGTHSTYSAYYQSLPVYGYSFKIMQFSDGSNCAILPIVKTSISDEPSFSQSENGLIDWLRKEGLLKTQYRHIKHCFPENNTLRYGWMVRYTKEGEDLETLVSESGEEVFSVSRSYYSRPDSLVKANVFLPDPITQARTAYGAPYVDNNDMNSETLNQWLVEVEIPVRWDSIFLVWILESDYAKIEELNDPDLAIPTSLTGDFLFERGDPEFEAVNIFYHINTMQAYLQSIGFFKLVNYQISIDPHGQGGADQSAFFPGGPSIMFGTGYVDDGEDADVIIHEYGHAISYSCAPNTNVGTSRQALDEGLGDYLAASYSLNISDYKALEIFNWDGHNDFFAGRYANVTRTYPSGLADNFYSDGEMWSSSLMDIHARLGREVTDKILFTSLCSYFPNMTLPQAAFLYMQADSLLFDTANSEAIRLEFCKRGLLPGCEDTIGVNQLIDGPFISNTEAFATEGAPILLYSNEFVIQYAELFTLNGALIETVELEQGLVTYELQFPFLRNGLYILQIHTTTGPKAFRILRLGSN